MGKRHFDSAWELERCFSDMLDRFIKSYTLENGCIQFGPDGNLIFTERGEELYDCYQFRLFRLGKKFFPYHRLSIYSPLVEPDPAEAFPEI